MAQLQTLSKALDILNVLGKSEHLMSVEEIAGELELPESTTYRLLQTLETKDFIQRYSRKKIGLGSNFIRLAGSLYGRLDQELILCSTPQMEQVRDLTGETVLLSIRAGIESMCIKSVSSNYIIRFVAEDNRLLRLDIGASSKGILAFEDQRIIDAVMELQETDEKRGTLWKELQQIRSQGYAITDNQFDVSAIGISVPVFNAYGRIYASLAVVGPDSRVGAKDYEQYVEILKKAAGEITEKLARSE